MFNKESGIYKIINIENKKIYIGSSIDISRRIRTHKYLLNKGKHHSIHLQLAWNKYGKNNFKFEVIEYCNEDELKEKEEYWITFYDCANQEYGYNIISISQGRNKHSEETKRKIKESNKYRKINFPSEETKKKISESSKGKRNTIEHNLKIKNSKLGVKRQKFSKEWINNMVKSRTKYFVNIYKENKLVLENVSVLQASNYLNVTPRSIYLSIKNNFKIKDHVILKQ